FVHPSDDVLVQHFEIEKLPWSPVANDASLVYYENLSPCTNKIPWFPLQDVYFDGLNDYACAYSSKDDALVHFRPRNANPLDVLAFVAAPHAQLASDVDAWLGAAGAL